MQDLTIVDSRARDKHVFDVLSGFGIFLASKAETWQLW
jgi:hypothetical protein